MDRIAELAQGVDVAAYGGRSLSFYEPVLASIGIIEVLVVYTEADEPNPQMHGFGYPYKPFFWLVADGRVGENMHVAFTVENRAAVRTFYAAALAAVGTSLHEPGVWEQYHPDYYGGFVLDPDGINVEAVCHRPE